MNKLYYGDNLDILQHSVDDESVDLVYLDPPFNSDQNYNILFAEQDGTRAAAQIKAFDDTWRWDVAAEAAYLDVVEGGGKPSQAMQAFRTFLGENDMLSYLAMMGPRLKELHRVLKDTGSLYLHCDPSASHYLKMLLDAIFGPDQYRNEIIWRRTGAHNNPKRYGPIHDVILFYSKSDNYKWNRPKRPYMRGHVQQYFIEVDGRYRTNYYGNVLTGSGTRGGESGQEWKGINPTDKGRHWAVPGAVVQDLLDEGVSLEGLGQHEKLDKLFDLGFITFEEGETWPIYQRYIGPKDGQAVQDIWAFQPYTNGTVYNTQEGVDEDIRWLSTKDQERLGYPTQKPEGLLERIIAASSDEGDVVLDPFCGCGTAIVAAHKLKRHWIGIDITHLAIALIKHRLAQTLGGELGYEVEGEPASFKDAQTLAEQDKYQFQWWALGRVGAMPTEKKKGADKGIDGRLYFHDERNSSKTKQVIISVKGGAVNVGDVRDLRGVVDREKADMGVVITLLPASKPMKTEAISAGFYRSPWTNKDHPKLQILTIEDLMNGKAIDMPPVGQTNVTMKRAKRAKEKPQHRQKMLDED